MRLQLWAMDIMHDTRDFNVDGDYMSKLATSTTFDPLLSKYLHFAADLCDKYPPPDGDMTPESMPGYQKPKRHDSPSNTDADYAPSMTIDGKPFDHKSHHVHFSLQQITAKRQLYFDTISVYPITYMSSPHPTPQFVTNLYPKHAD